MQNLYLIIIALMLIGIGTFIGRRFPTSEKKRHLKELGVREMLQEWYAGFDWKCIKTFEDNGGPFGNRLRKVVIESNRTRFTLICFDEEIVEGTSVELRLRNSEENTGVWIGPVNQHMIPVALRIPTPVAI